MTASDSRKALERRAALKDERFRRLAARDLLTYAQRIMPFYRVGHHHRKIAEALMMVEAGIIDRLLIVMPPRHGKSLLASVIYPAWYMGRNPTREIIAWSYGGELVSGFGARLRNIMKSPEHLEIFGLESALAADTRARDRWLTNAGGVYRAAGSGGAITGFGAHVFIIDDPVKGYEEAYSPTVQNKTWTIYQHDIYPRVMKGGAIIDIQTRWVENDLAGRLLEEQDKDGDTWHTVYYPASRHRETGKPVDPTHPEAVALWPDEYPLEDLDRKRRVVGPIAWQAEYQGNPMPEEGSYFLLDWLQTYDERPDVSRMRIYGASDYAVTHQAGDWTVHVIVGVDQFDDIYILDMWREQSESDRWIDALCDLMLQWKPILWGEEGGQIRRSLGPYIAKRQRERKAWGARLEFSSSADKPTRARSFQARVAAKRVYFPSRKPWWPEMQSELLRFPTGKNDDIVDALSLIGRMLDVLATGKTAPGPANRDGALVIGAAPPAGMRPVTYGDMAAITRSENARRREGRRTLH